MTVALMSLSFWLVKKNQYRTSALAISLSVLCFVIAQLNGDFLSKFWNDLSLEQFVCWGFGFAFLILAVYFAHKDSLAYAFVILLISVFACFCGLSGVQALLKTHLLWQVTSTLQSYGEKIDNYQKTVADMHQSLSQQQFELSSNQLILSKGQDEFKVQIADVEKRLSKQQDKIADAAANVSSQQSAITNQFQQISTLQNQLLATTTNLDSQTKKLSDIEYWVDNLYDKTTNVTFSVADTNNVLFISNTNGAIAYIVRLNHVPIKGSVEMTIVDASSRYPTRLFATEFLKNMFWGDLYSFDTNTLTFSFHYVVDSRETNFNKQMLQLGKDFSLSPDLRTLNYSLDKLLSNP